MILAGLTARREAAQATIRRMHEAVERSRRLLLQTTEVLERVRPSPPPDGGAPAGETKDEG